jgi:hypothetical protein
MYRTPTQKETEDREDNKNKNKEDEIYRVALLGDYNDQIRWERYSCK